jgi:hypothetical protein
MAVDPKTLTFKQRMGLEPLPAPLALDQISPKLRARLWDVVHSAMYDNRGEVRDRWFYAVRERYIDGGGMSHQFRWAFAEEELADTFQKGQCHEVLRSSS